MPIKIKNYQNEDKINEKKFSIDIWVKILKRIFAIPAKVL